MVSASISDVGQTLQEPLDNLDCAYWEATTMSCKDLFHDLIATPGPR